MALSHGQMAENMKVITAMIRKKVRVLSTGPTVENMKEAGKMANSMELGITLQQAEK